MAAAAKVFQHLPGFAKITWFAKQVGSIDHDGIGSNYQASFAIHRFCLSQRQPTRHIARAFVPLPTLVYLGRRDPHTQANKLDQFLPSWRGRSQQNRYFRHFVRFAQNAAILS
jgi:hypothetical protein